MKAFERKLLTAKILQGPMNQLIISSAMMDLYNLLGCEQLVHIGFAKLIVYYPAHPNIRVKDGVRPSKFKKHLLVFIDRKTINSPAKFLPTAASICKLYIIPNLILVLVSAPKRSITVRNKDPYVIIEFSPTDIANPQGLKHFEQLLVKKATIKTDDNGHILLIMFTDKLNNMPNHFSETGRLTLSRSQM